MRLALILMMALGVDATATQALRERDAEMRAALPPPGQALPDAGREKFERIVSRIVDTRGMLESALGSRWTKMTPKEQKRLLDAFERRFQRAGGAQVDTLRDARIDYLGEKPRGDLVVVATRLRAKDEASEVNYVMRNRGGAWRIVDVEVDGVSTVENYRASFARIIGKEGVEGLIRRLERGGDSRD